MSNFTYNCRRGFGGLRIADNNVTDVTVGPVIKRPLIHRTGIVTIVEHQLQSTIGLALGKDARVVHSAGIADAHKIANQNTMGVLLVSPSLVSGVRIKDLKMLLGQCPGFVSALVVSELTPNVAKELLVFGACGINAVLDLSSRSDWAALRSLLSEQPDSVVSIAAEQLKTAFDCCALDVQRFFFFLLRTAPEVTTVRALCLKLGVSTSTLTSRFFRAQLPSPKFYLAVFRLLHATALLDDRSISIASASHRLRYSSPQSFSRHVKIVLGVSAQHLRKQFGFNALLDNVIDRLFLRYKAELQQLHPYG